MDQLKLPEYVIPKDLEDLLNSEQEVFSWSSRARVFSQVLEILKNVDHIDMSENHYLLLLKLALYLEEYKRVCDMKSNAIEKKKIESRNKRRPKLIQIPMGDNIENKLFIKTDDFIVLTSVTQNYKKCTLRVTEITQSHIKASDDQEMFRKTFKNQNTFSVEFQFNNHSMRCAHFTLWLMYEKNSLTYLFPFKEKPFIKDENMVYSSDLKIINAAIESNPEQKQAVLNIINRSSFPVPYILYGSPGTGKTTTLVEAISQLHRNFLQSNILVCTPTNTAADEITKMLLKYVPSKDLYRVYSQLTEGWTIDKEIQKCANYENGEVIFPKYLDYVKKRIIITTLCDCMRLLLIGIEASHFSHVIIDDAGHATEPDILIPISLVSEDGKLNSQIVLAGDPKILGPNVKSKIVKCILGRSILERLMFYEIYQKDSNNKYNSKYITKLLYNYRNHPDILHISNKLFYNNELIPKCERNANEKFPVIFYGVDGPEEKEARTNNPYNQVEIDVIVDYVDDLLNNRICVGGVTKEDIGIVTPFAAQSKLIKRTLKSIQLGDVKVGTIDFFEGDQRKVMIMSAVKSKTYVENGVEHIGILSDAKQFNVAMTRATEFFIVVGNPNVLQIDDKWRFLIKYCLDNKSYDGVDFTLDSKSIKEEGDLLKIAAVNSSSLFEDNLLKLFSIDEYNPEIDLAQIAPLSLEAPYNKLVNPVGYWDMHSSEDNIVDHFITENQFDHTDSQPEDVFNNIDSFEVQKLLYMSTFENSNKTQQNSTESVIKNALDDLNNLLKDDISQSNSNKKKRQRSRKRVGKQQDLLLKNDDSKSVPESNQTESENSNASKTSNYEQNHIIEAGTSSNESESNDTNSVHLNDLKQSVDNQEGVHYKTKNSENVPHSDHTEFEKSSDSDTSQDRQKKMLGVSISNNVSQSDFTTLGDSSNFKKLREEQDDLLCETNDCETSTHSVQKELEASVASKTSHDESNNLLGIDNVINVNQPGHTKLDDLLTRVFNKLRDKQEDLPLEIDNSKRASHSGLIQSEDTNISKTQHDEQKDLPEVDILKSIKSCGYESLAISSEPKISFEQENKPILTADNPKNEPHDAHIVSENSSVSQKSDYEKEILEMNILKIINDCVSKGESHEADTVLKSSTASKTAHDEQKSLLEIDVSKMISDCDYANLTDSSEFSKFFDQQEELPLKSNYSENPSNSDPIGFENLYSSKHVSENTKNQITSCVSENVEKRDCSEFLDARLESIPSDDQKDLMDLNSSIRNDDLSNLIEFEDVLEDPKNVPKNCDIVENDYVDLL